MLRKWSLLTFGLLTLGSLALTGCGGEEPKPAEVKSETHVAKPGPAAEAGPVDPSPVPSLPPTTSPMPDDKKNEAKKEEPKMEPPK